ncbi:MAG: hypothetical protein HC896_11075, partial [Bacteroidales bacterium]|nr:hypothetical protein [Bacteroidales bacterium]
MEKQKSLTLEQLQTTEKLLETTETNKVNQINELNIISKRIELRTNLIGSIGEEMELLSKRIIDKEQTIDLLSKDLEKVKAEYEKIILHAYKRGYSNNFLVYLFASEDFNQAYKRFTYYRYLSKFRKKQVMLIAAIQNTVYSEILDLERKIDEQKALLTQKEQEQFELLKEKNQKSAMVSELKNKEKELKKEAKEKRLIAEKLEAEIIKIIAAEAKKARVYESLTPEDKLIADNFKTNMGRLPWPTRQGIVTSGFGENEHPVLKGNKVMNNGIDITTVAGSEVRVLLTG